MLKITESFREEKPQLTVYWGDVYGGLQLVVECSEKRLFMLYFGIPVRRKLENS